MKRLAIIGAGASGLIASIIAQEAGLEVTIYESNDQVGKKILASGNGRCNIGNRDITPQHYHGQNPSFVEYALKNITFSDVKEFFYRIGLLLDTKDDGRTYPFSNEARSVLIALESKVKALGVTIILNTPISKLERSSHTFTLKSDEKLFKGFDLVLIASGLQAAPQLGSTSKGLDLARSFGHTVFDPFASLVQLECKEHSITSKMAGVRLNAFVTLYIDNKVSMLKEGDMLFTKYGLSGLAILDCSHEASFALQKGKKVVISIALVGFSGSELLGILLSLKDARSGTVEEMLTALVPLKVAKTVATTLDLYDKEVRSLNVHDIQRIIERLLNWRFAITQTHGFKHAEVAGGGVNTLEVDAKTFESKRCKDLYFSGEVLDVVGDRGGYNFHFAWASGILAAQAMVKA